MLTKAKERAKLKSLEYNLTREWIGDQLKSGKCPMVDLPFKYDEPRHPMTPSIDKIDPNGGYTQDNCRVVCYWFNTMKSDYSDERVIHLIKQMVKTLNL